MGPLGHEPDSVWDPGACDARTLTTTLLRRPQQDPILITFFFNRITDMAVCFSVPLFMPILQSNISEHTLSGLLLNFLTLIFRVLFKLVTLEIN